MSLVTLSTKGQVVLPSQVRRLMSLREGDRLSLTIEAGRLVLAPLSSRRDTGWRNWRGRLSGTDALQQHVAEHADEVNRERLP